MAFQSVNTKASYVDLKKCKKNDVIAEGRFVGTYTDQFNHLRYKVQTRTGTLVLPNTGDLNFKFKEYVQMNDEIRVIYLGTENIKTKKFGFKDVHQFDVQIDQDARTTDKGESNVQEASELDSLSSRSQSRETTSAGSNGRSSSASKSSNSMGSSSSAAGSEDSDEDSEEDLFEEENSEKEALITEIKKAPKKQMSREEILAQMNTYRQSKA